MLHIIHKVLFRPHFDGKIVKGPSIKMGIANNIIQNEEERRRILQIVLPKGTSQASTKKTSGNFRTQPFHLYITAKT